MPMQILVMGSAERNCKFIADFAAQRSWLGEFHMMGI
jgi:hypothetical protein